jgi:transposase-like protein
VINPDVGVSPTRTRRRFTTAYKRRILDAVAACTHPGEIGALLRREGLYSSHLTAWRAANRRGALTGPLPRRGPVATPPDPRVQQIAQLERQVRQLTRRAERAELIVDAQKKFSQLIGLTLPPLDAPTETPS